MAIEDVDMQDSVYDPDQDPEATRDIRRKYRRAVQQLTGTCFSPLWLPDTSYNPPQKRRISVPKM